MMSDLLLAYSEAHTTPEPPVLAGLNRETHLSQVYPQMLSGHLQGALLRMFCQMIRPERVLEIGTFTGYSAIAMGLGMTSPPAFAGMPSPGTLAGMPSPGALAGMPSPGALAGMPSPRTLAGMPSPPTPLPQERGGVLLHTVEVNRELEDGIRKFIHEAGLEDRIVLHIGEALEIIPLLNEVWDLVFIDADKPNYLNYYNMVLPLIRPGGFIIADNVLWDGKVTGDPAKMDKDTRGIVEFNKFVHQDERVENLILPVRDGLMVIRKI